MSSSSQRRLLAVVTVYRPDPGVIENLERIARQVDEFVVVDDGSGAAFEPVLGAISTVAGAQVVSLPENSGIATALNVGVRTIAPADGDVVVTFDQDSRIPEGFVEGLTHEFDRALAAGVNAAIVAPATFADVDQTGPATAPGFVEALRPIQSGMMISGCALRQLGGFDEGLFIDLVDVEFYLRAKASGGVAVAVPGLDLPHELGHVQSMVFLGRSVSTTLSAPFRYYYRVRNRLIVGKRYRRNAGALLRKEARRDFAHFAVAVAFAQTRMPLVRIMMRGARDARRGRTGRIPADVEQMAAAVAWRGARVRRSAAQS